MSENDTQRTDQNHRKRLWRVQSAVAAANEGTARAVTQAAGLTDTPHPIMALSNTHGQLLDAYQEVTRALDRTEQEMDAMDEDYGDPTPRQIKTEHAERIKERYEGPVLNLALMLLERNRREWLHRKPGTNGAETVERHGLTSNQRAWLDDLDDAWGEYDG